MFDGFAGAVSPVMLALGLRASEGPRYQEADSVTRLSSVSDAAALLGRVVNANTFVVAADTTSGTV